MVSRISEKKSDLVENVTQKKNPPWENLPRRLYVSEDRTKRTHSLSLSRDALVAGLHFSPTRRRYFFWSSMWKTPDPSWNGRKLFAQLSFGVTLKARSWAVANCRKIFVVAASFARPLCAIWRVGERERRADGSVLFTLLTMAMVFTP